MRIKRRAVRLFFVYFLLIAVGTFSIFAEAKFIMCDEVRCIVSKLLLWISLWPENRQVSIYERACVGTSDGTDSTMPLYTTAES